MCKFLSGIIDTSDLGINQMKYQPEPTSLNQARAAFQKIWGYDDFRPPQGEIVSSLLAEKIQL
jgi:superfamily II DNA helicase RecQ